MPHVLKYQGHYVRIEIGEVARFQAPDKEYVEYVAWCSDACKELRDLPRQSLSQLVPGLLPSYAEALRHAQDWIKTSSTIARAKSVEELVGFLYTVWLFKGESGSSSYDFSEFADAKEFAQAAEKSAQITKVGITDRESPQYLAVWEKTS
jgi:hypothetical protein